MKGFYLYRAGFNLYCVGRFGNVRVYVPSSKTWWPCCASARTVRARGKLVAKNVVFK